MEAVFSLFAKYQISTKDFEPYWDKSPLMRAMLFQTFHRDSDLMTVILENPVYRSALGLNDRSVAERLLFEAMLRELPIIPFFKFWPLEWRNSYFAFENLMQIAAFDDGHHFDEPGYFERTLQTLKDYNFKLPKQ
jgi:hypothetical protein